MRGEHKSINSFLFLFGLLRKNISVYFVYLYLFMAQVSVGKSHKKKGKVENDGEQIPIRGAGSMASGSGFNDSSSKQAWYKWANQAETAFLSVGFVCCLFGCPFGFVHTPKNNVYFWKKNKIMDSGGSRSCRQAESPLFDGCHRQGQQDKYLDHTQGAFI